MADVLDATGLTIESLNEIITALTNGLKTIYGSDINVDQNSPDGQRINIFAQAAYDLRELAVSVYNSFDPDRAIGTVLDERVAINNIQRLGGTFTIQPIEITVSDTTSLQGLDGAFNDINGTGYTVQDDAGNQFILVDSVTLTTGTRELNFRAKNIGQVETTVNTITNPVTIVLGVIGINNPNGALQTGQNEETDAELRLRRQRSVAIASNGYLNGLLAAVLNLDGVNDGAIYENVTNSTDADGIPAHGIWLIAEGGANADIAGQIYAKKSYGANMKGAVSVDITTASGATFTALFDRPTSEDLYIEFNIQKIVSTATFDLDALKQYIVDNLVYNIYGYADTASVTAIAKAGILAQSAQGVPVDVFISLDGVTWVDFLYPTTKDKQFVLDVTRITPTVL